MSDEPDRPRVITAPLGVSPAPAPEPPPPVTAKLEPPAPMTAKLAPAPANARPATQMSASAVPSTLESPQDPSAATDGTAVVIAPNALGTSADEIHGAALVRGDTGRGDTVRDDPSVPPGLEATAPASARGHGGPATMMSPAVAAPLPGASTPPLAPENAVVDVGAPAHAFVPYGSGAPPGFGGPHGMAHHHGIGPGGAATRRPMSTTFLLLVIGGVVAAIALLAVAVIGFVFVSRRNAADGDDPRGSRQPGVTVAPGSPESPRLPPRMGGTRARVSVTTRARSTPRGSGRRSTSRSRASTSATPRPSSTHRITSRRPTSSTSHRTARCGAPSRRRSALAPRSSTHASSRTSARSACRAPRARAWSSSPSSHQSSLAELPANAALLLRGHERMTVSFMVR